MKEFLKKNIVILCLLLAGEIAIIVTSIILKSSPLTICYSILMLIYAASTVMKVWISPILGLGVMALYIAQNVLVSNWGEVILTAAVVLPMLVYGIVSYIKNRKKEKFVVENIKISLKEFLIMLGACLAVTIGMFFLLDYLKTPYIYVALFPAFLTMSSYYLFVRRDKIMFLFFGLNNISLIILWLMPIFAGQTGGEGLIPISINYAFVFTFNLFGIIDWIKSLKNTKKYLKTEQKIEQNTEQKIEKMEEK